MLFTWAVELLFSVLIRNFFQRYTVFLQHHWGILVGLNGISGCWGHCWAFLETQLFNKAKYKNFKWELPIFHIAGLCMQSWDDLVHEEECAESICDVVVPETSRKPELYDRISKKDWYKCRELFSMCFCDDKCKNWYWSRWQNILERRSRFMTFSPARCRICNPSSSFIDELIQQPKLFFIDEFIQRQATSSLATFHASRSLSNPFWLDHDFTMNTFTLNTSYRANFQIMQGNSFVQTWRCVQHTQEVFAKAQNFNWQLTSKVAWALAFLLLDNNGECSALECHAICVATKLPVVNASHSKLPVVNGNVHSSWIMARIMHQHQSTDHIVLRPNLVTLVVSTLI